MQKAESKSPCKPTYKLPNEVESEMGSLICRAAKTYFENPDHCRAFEGWYLKRYGTPYQWGKEAV